MRRWTGGLAAGVLVGTLTAADAAAQAAAPLPPFVVDARGALPRLGQLDATAASLGVAATDLAGRGLGLTIGAHVYPIRRSGWAMGFGGELLLSRASREVAGAGGEPTGRTIARRLESLSGQISLNFGHRDGWSYLSGGIGPVAFDTWDDADTPDGVRAMTLNYGGGARWFTRPRIAFEFDVRFYATRPADPTLIVAARSRQTVMVISVGVGIR
jgi:hypothetical protein